MNSKGIVQVYVKQKYRAKLAVLAVRRNRKESELVRMAFEEWIEKQGTSHAEEGYPCRTANEEG